MSDLDSKPIRSGMVAIVGPPNAGKSTLMNGLLEQKISIVSPKPQTTRNRILGIMNGPEYQIVLLDTPGLHKAREPLNQEMVRIALESLHEVDAVLYLIDVSLPLPEKLKAEKGQELTGYMEQVRCPVILVLNKVDLLIKEKLLAMIQTPGSSPFMRLFPYQRLLEMARIVFWPSYWPCCLSGRAIILRISPPMLLSVF
jgi:GTPase